jgi:hypothetical protein
MNLCSFDGGQPKRYVRGAFDAGTIDAP